MFSRYFIREIQHLSPLRLVGVALPRRRGLFLIGTLIRGLQINRKNYEAHLLWDSPQTLGSGNFVLVTMLVSLPVGFFTAAIFSGRLIRVQVCLQRPRN